MTYLLQIAAISTYISFIWGVNGIFRKVDNKESPAFRIVKGISLLCMGAFLYGMSQHEQRRPLETGLAFALFTYSHVFFWWAMQAAKRKTLSVAFSSDTPEVLLSHGPYRWVRHPFYSSYLASYLASAIAAGIVPYVVFFLPLLGFYFWCTKLEETKFACSSLSETYSHYQKITGRFTPVKSLFDSLRKLI